MKKPDNRDMSSVDPCLMLGLGLRAWKRPFLGCALAHTPHTPLLTD